ncbi:MAG: hypothetical protein HY755_13255 [Nitrospirae bacterium]|nr:hypothetical protein [Nitrospirota bacterium]
MTYKEAFNNGLNIVHKNWQLVLIQVAMIITNCILFFIFIGIPLAIAFVMFGLDLTEMTRLKDLLITMREPSEIISRYRGIFLVLLVAFIGYLLVASSIGLYFFGGSAGLIARSIRDNTLRFSLKIFFAEGKRLFLPLVGFTAIIGLIFTCVALVLGIFGGGIGAIIASAREQEAIFTIFLGIFFSLLLFCTGLILIAFTIALALYGLAAVIFKGTGAFKSIKESARYLYHQPRALWLYCIVFSGYIGVSFILILLGAPFSFIPIVGPIIALPYQLFSYTVQSYLGLVILAITFTYYFSTEGKSSETPDITVVPIAEWSSQTSDTSHFQEPRPETPPQELEKPE